MTRWQPPSQPPEKALGQDARSRSKAGLTQKLKAKSRVDAREKARTGTARLRQGGAGLQGRLVFFQAVVLKGFASQTPRWLWRQGRIRGCTSPMVHPFYGQRGGPARDAGSLGRETSNCTEDGDEDSVFGRW